MEVRRAIERGSALLDAAMRAGPHTEAGRAARSAAERVYLREARRLHRLAARRSDGDDLERLSREFLARALAVRQDLADEQGNGSEAPMHAATATIVLTPTPGDKKINVTWPPVPLAVSYEATATLVGGASPEQTASTFVPQASLLPLQNGKAYLIEVRAYGAGNVVLAEGQTTATPLSPLTPSAIPGNKQLVVTWTIAGTLPQTPTGFRVTATAPGATSPSSTALTGPAVLTATLSNLENGVPYLVAVEAMAGTTVITRGETMATPASPLQVTATPGDQQVVVEWSVIGLLPGTPSAYKVTATAPSATNPAATANVPASAPKTATLTTNLVNGTTYRIVVEALAGTTVLGSEETVATPFASLAITVIPGDKKLTVSYRLVRQLPVAPTSYRATATPQPGTTPVVTVVRNASAPQVAVLGGLTNGTTYKVDVTALDGTNVLSAVNALETPRGLIPATFPPLELQPLSVADPNVAATRRALAEALRVGSKWRFDYLRAQALAIAEDAGSFDAQLTQLMALDLEKVGIAEELLGDYLRSVTESLQGILTKVQAVAPPDVDDPVAEVADAINTFVLLERLLVWLATHDAIDFWVGLFGRTIDDIAAFDTGLTRTRRYLRAQFATADVQAAVTAMLADAKEQVNTLVDELAAPLRAAIGDAVSTTAASMEAVFESFDEPLLVNAGTDPGGVSSSNGLATLSEQLLAAVERLVAELKAQVERALDLKINPDFAASLFEAIVVAYVVLPILSALVIAIGGGPISAGLLAAAVTLAAQELLHLVAQWLSGPLRGEVDEARARVGEALALLKETVASSLPTSLGASTSPAHELKLLGGQLGALKELLPEAFLDQSAALLEDARDALLGTAGSYALAAEQALGLENAAVFDDVDTSYKAELPPAPELPGGLGAARFATAALVRDLARLERRRVELLDGKEVEVTLRLSLFRELGGDGDPANPTAPAFVAGEFARLLRGEEVALRLTEESLIDRGYPGLYRILLSEVRVLGVFDQQPTGELVSVNVPVQITHLGESRTRIRKSASFDEVENPQKWGPAYLEADRDPQIGSLGFLTLVRRLPAETEVFSLVPAAGSPFLAQSVAVEGLGSSDPPSQNEQYRPFENRGLEGTLALRLPLAEPVPDVLGESRPNLFTAAGAPRLIDVLLDVRLRACHDQGLAAAVRAAQEQRASALETAAVAIDSAAGQLIMGGLLPHSERSDRRTIHFSLRAHRDQTLRFWKAVIPVYVAEQGTQPTGGADWSKLQTTKQLGPNDPFKPLPLLPSGTPLTPMPKFKLAFGPASEPTAAGGAELAQIASQIVVTPETLGLSPDLVQVGAVGAGLVGIGVSIVPTQKGATVLGLIPRGNPTPWGASGITDAAVAALDERLCVAVVGGTAGSAYAAVEQVDAWQPFSPLPVTPGALSRIASATVGRELHALAIRTAGGDLQQTARRVAGWDQWGPVPGTPASLVELDVAEVAGALHCACVSAFPGQLFHAIRTGTSWSGFGDMFATVSRFTRGGTIVNYAHDVSCVELAGELHVVAAVRGLFTGSFIVSSRRRADGGWEFAWEWLPTSMTSVFDTIVSVAAARVGREIQACWCDSTGKAWFATRRENGTWSSVEPIGFGGQFTRAACTEVQGELRVIFIRGGKPWLTTRHANGTWDPLSDLAARIDLRVDLTDPLAGLEVHAQGPLAAVLAGFATSTAPGPGERLLATPFKPPPEPVVEMKKLFDLALGAALEIDLDDPVSKDLIYDIIFSLTYSLPLQTVTPSV